MVNRVLSKRKVLIGRDQIQKRVDELAHEIAGDYRGKRLLLVVVLKGAFVFAADLQRALWTAGFYDIETKFVGVSSYGNLKVSSGVPTITHGESVKVSGWHVLFVEDIVDTGFTVKALYDFFEDKGALSMETIVLLSKPEKRKVDAPVKYTGFEIAKDDWVEGYGIDTAQHGRGNPDIVVVREQDSVSAI